jgi:class 3 adenylate cyclase
MSWSETKSKERVQAHLGSIGDIEVKPLAREVNDLEAILSETVCRDIFAAHVYIDVTNFTALSSDATMKRENYKRLIQAAHLYQRALTRVAEDVLAEFRVHFQGSKIHVLCYLPVSDSATIAARAALMLLVANDFVRSVFNKEFSDYSDWSVGGGADIGNAIGTRNGKNGDRELLFIGNPANLAAKLLTDTSTLRLTERLFKALPASIQTYCSQLKSGDYRISAAQDKLDELCKANGIPWDRKKSAEQLADDRKALPLADIDYSDAEVRIDFEKLSETNNKQVLGASVFADVSGFTKFVSDAKGEEAKASALKVFHVIRKELAKVGETDYKGVRVQFQGDRIQVLFHLPKGDEDKIAVEAVEAAVGMLSSFEQVIKKELPEAKNLALKVGVDMGTTLATRLGKRGDRDNICLGIPPQNAARLEEDSNDSEIAVSQAIYDGLGGNELQAYFTEDTGRRCWVAKGLTYERVEAEEDSKSYDTGKALLIGGAIAAGAALGAFAISQAKTKEDERRAVEPSRTYGS